MYRTGDPRFRRRLNEIGQTLESANESAQSNIYIFGQTYVKPCLESVGQCFTTCIEASCPTLNLTAGQRERLRRQRGQERRRGRAELSFDFYDDWDDDENDALMGWGNDEFDRLLSGSGGYGTISSTHTNAQPQRQRGMSYPKARRKSAVQPHDGGPDPTVIPGSSLFGRLFGGKILRYKPSAADLQEHPGAKKSADLTEGEALLEQIGEGNRRKHRRIRSNTANSGHTTDSLSSRGDIFPSDEELDDAIPLDDEFAMVLERRTTNSGASGPDTETSSGRTRDSGDRRRRGKRLSTGSRNSPHSSQSRGGGKNRSRTNSSAAQTPIDELAPLLGDEDEEEDDVDESKQPSQAEDSKDVNTTLNREDARTSIAETTPPYDVSKEATPEVRTPHLQPIERHDEPSEMTTPLATTDDEDESASAPSTNKGKDTK